MKRLTCGPPPHVFTPSRTHVGPHARLTPPLAVTLQVVSIVLFTFIGYLNIGIPLAVLPGYVHNDLGFSTVVAGLVISVQYLATLLSRPAASRIIDNHGSKKAVIYGLAGCGISGVFMLACAFPTHRPGGAWPACWLADWCWAAPKAWWVRAR